MNFDQDLGLFRICPFESIKAEDWGWSLMFNLPTINSELRDDITWQNWGYFIRFEIRTFYANVFTENGLQQTYEGYHIIMKVQCDLLFKVKSFSICTFR